MCSTFEPDDPVDFIISSQFTHHLDAGEIVAFIHWMEAHARRGWLISDLHRHWFPYYGFGLLALAARWHRFVRQDGRISIARGFVAEDWRRLIEASGLAPEAVDLRWHVPFRHTIAHRCGPPLILGGGPSGAAAACLIAEAGDPVTCWSGRTDRRTRCAAISSVPRRSR